MLHTVTHNTYPDDSSTTFVTSWSKVLLVVTNTEQLTRLLHETFINQRHTTLWISTYKVIRTPSLLQS